jgi:hypothetical protein
VDLLNYSGQFCNNRISLRHYCRNSRCRGKLNTPTDNPHKAFCCKGCHNSFYLKKCLVCERPITKTTSRQEICKRRSCRNAFRSNRGRYRYPGVFSGPATPIPASAFCRSEVPVKWASKPVPAADRPWRIVAGSAISACAYHCATLDPPKIEAWQPPQAAPKASAAPTDLNRLAKIPDDIPSDLLIPQFLRRESHTGDAR